MNEFFTVERDARGITGLVHLELCQPARLNTMSLPFFPALRDVLRTFCQVADWAYGARWVLNNQEQKLNCVEIWHVNDPAIAAFAAVTPLSIALLIDGTRV